jgi:ADP-ribosylglycohydrolase
VRQLDRIRGCLLGGAAGDALGAPVEFMTGADIAARFGPDGVTALPEGPGRITDDTQMTLFTAEGLIRAHNRLADRGTCDVPAVVLRAYQRWLFTQEGGRRAAVPWDPEFPAGPSGWLVEQPFLHDRRAPGEGWVAEEALAIAVYCALVAPTFRAGVLLAVNHGGDSDSTAAMTGNLLGAALGAQAIDDDLLNGLEGRDVIEQVAADLGAMLDGGMPRPCDLGRYPPW